MAFQGASFQQLLLSFDGILVLCSENLADTFQIVHSQEPELSLALIRGIQFLATTVLTTVCLQNISMQGLN